MSFSQITHLFPARNGYMNTEQEEMKDMSNDTQAEWIILAFLRWAPLSLVAFLLVSRPVSSSLIAEVGTLSLYTMLLLVTLVFDLSGRLLNKSDAPYGGAPAVLYGLFLLWALVSCIAGVDRFDAMRTWLLYATYGFTALLMIRVGDTKGRRRFLFSCILATSVALGAYALFHWLFYLPAMQQWVEGNPEYFQAVFGSSDRVMGDLLRRVRGRDAMGNFITGNQLASYLLMGGFPLLACLWGAILRSRSGGWREMWLRPRSMVMLFATLMVGVVVILTNSKGGMLGAVVGVLILAGVLGKDFFCRHWWKISGAFLFILAMLLLWQGDRVVSYANHMKRSLAVRGGYWRASGEMALARPLLGVGMGAWEDHYTMLKGPGDGETQLAHNAYLQVLSETGFVGFGLLVIAALLVIFRIFKGMAGLRRGEKEVESGDPDTNAPPVWSGGIIAGLALALDYFFAGSLRGPAIGLPLLLEIAPWLVYVMVFVVWYLVFKASYCGDCLVKDRRLFFWGLVAGLGAFLFHSGGEFTFRIPAVGGTAFAMAALLYGELRSGSIARQRAAKFWCALAVVIVFLVSLGWALAVLPGALDYSFFKGKIMSLRGELAGGDEGAGVRSDVSAEDAIELHQELVDTYRLLVGLKPLVTKGYKMQLSPFGINLGRWDDESWAELASAKMAFARFLAGRMVGKDAEDSRIRIGVLLREAEEAARRAVVLNPLSSSNYRNLGEILLAKGKGEEAVECFRKAAELHPSLPLAWFRYAQVAEDEHGLTEPVLEAYRKALELSDPDVLYHGRNVLKPEEEEIIREKLKAGQNG
jgi:O-antigen ligase